MATAALAAATTPVAACSTSGTAYPGADRVLFGMRRSMSRRGFRCTFLEMTELLVLPEEKPSPALSSTGGRFAIPRWFLTAG
jgi:hypothetical protein